ncbi:MAG TPA: PQQ-binding-like beta-propeller repeat protein [Myxococcales bacterium]|nr:PQQ-binding-like beta-propeller repeat protein [Myxococcales bacterium]
MLPILALALAQATFHGNVARTGVFAGAGPLQPSVKWTFKTDGPIVGSAAVDGGVVYVASLDTHLSAIDAATGKEKWSFKSSQPIRSSPAIAGGLVYFVSSAGSLAALDAATGKPKWVLPTEYERRFQAKNLHGYPPAEQTMPDAYDLFTSSPAVANGKVFFGSGDGNVYAADAATGVLQWKFATRDVVHTSPAVAGGLVYVGSWDSTLYALDADTGALRWSFAAGQDDTIHNQVGFQGSPAVVDGTVYVGCRDAHVYALDAGSGKKRWDYPTSKSWVIGTPAVRDGLVWVGTSDSSRLMALDAKSGRLRFNVDARGYMFSSPAIAGDLVYAGDHNGRLYAVGARSGKIAWEFQTEASKKDPYKVLTAEGRIDAPTLYAPMFFDFQDMYVAASKLVSIGAIVASPTIDNGTLYVGSMDGTFYAIGSPGA